MKFSLRRLELMLFSTLHRRLTIEKTEIIPDTSTTQSNASPAEMITGLAKRAGGLLMPKATRLTRHDALFFPAEARI